MSRYHPAQLLLPKLEVATAVPMLVICPITLVVTMAFIQRGFRR